MSLPADPHRYHYKIPEMIAYRDRLTNEWQLDHDLRDQRGARLQAKTNLSGRECRPDHLLPSVENRSPQEHPQRRRAAVIVYNHGKGHTNWTRTTEPFTGIIAGVRADEEGSRSKERYFSPRDQQNLWDIGDQPPEFWNQYKTDFAPQAPTSASIRCSTGRNSISGNTSSGKRSRRSPSTTIRGTGNGTAPWGVIPALSRLTRRRGRSTRSSRSSEAENSKTSPNAPAGPRTRMTAAGLKPCAEKDTCKVMKRKRADEHRYRRARGPRQEHHHRQTAGRHRVPARG